MVLLFEQTFEGNKEFLKMQKTKIKCVLQAQNYNTFPMKWCDLSAGFKGGGVWQISERHVALVLHRLWFACFWIESHFANI